MQRKYKNKFIQGLLFAILFLGFQACDEIIIKSVWMNDAITIDGSRNDWKGNLKYFSDEKVALGISNDNDHINFCVATSDNKKIMKILRGGFTVWLEPKNNNDNNKIGIQYPIKKEGQIRGKRPSKGMQNDINMSEHFKNIFKNFKTMQSEILIVNKENYPINTYPLTNGNGFEVSIDYQMHQLVYELKFPLANKIEGEIYANVLSGKLLEVGFESGKIKMERPEGRGGKPSGVTGGRPGGSGRTGGVGRPGGGRLGGGRPNRSDMQEMINPIKLEFDVKLAEKKDNNVLSEK